MKYAIYVSLLVLLFSPAAYSSLNPSEILVVYNGNSENPLAPASAAIADYYCGERGIPAANKFALTQLGRTSEDMLASEFASDVYIPLRNHLQSTFGSDPANPGADPIKCIVLCYGVPTQICTADRVASVDSVLTCLFQHAPWGRSPMAITSSYVYRWPVNSPYQDAGGTNYISARGDKPVDFGAFRESSFNDTPETAPNFTVVRMAGASNAFACGEQGMLYHGTYANDTWSWEVTLDEDKAFVGHTITDIWPISATTALACSEGGSILRTTNGGATWSLVRSGAHVAIGNYRGPADCLNQIVFADSSNGWCVGWKINGLSGPVFTKTTDGGATWASCVNSLPAGMTTPRTIAALDTDDLWIAGDNGLWFSDNVGTSWTQQVAIITFTSKSLSASC